MPEETKLPEDDGRLLADPFHLNALASLGQNVPKKLIAAPANESVAVLPFTNISGGAAQESFTDGLTEDIITVLSNVKGFFVITRTSVFAYKGKPTHLPLASRRESANHWVPKI